jgi:hypothetical protein
MELRLKFQEIQSDPTRLQCPHPNEPTRRQVCIHLICQAPIGRRYYRYFPNEPGYFAIICPACYDQPEQIAASLRTVCKSCYLDYLNKELGQIGVPQFLSRPSSLDFSHETLSLTEFDGVEIWDIQPIEGAPGNVWLALTSKKKLVQIDFEQRTLKTLCTVLKGKINWQHKVVLHVSRNGQYAAVANLRGQYGVLLNLCTARETLRLDRGQYHTAHSHFSIAFAEIDDKTILVHATDWNRLTISDPATGQELTAREVPLWQKGEPPPDHYLDYFHGSLVVSPDQEWIADWGWFWHPLGILRCWSLKKWLYENVWESEDARKRKGLCFRSYYWDGPMCWMDSSRLIAWGYGEDEEDLIPAATIYDAQTA